ncbi:unnamed protein product [Fusarium graminearum]|nr:unnamed protein product [Fusarium graminearum]CAG2001383.1 unnamed protein product [Fusarium graminearum]VTO93527.1 unnamed protein product [Fusarium graminearum]
MVLVVFTVDCITTLPARREHELETNSILTVRIKVALVGHVVAVKSAFRSLIIVEAVEAKRTLSQITLRSLAKSLPLGLLRVWFAWVTEGVCSSIV